MKRYASALLFSLLAGNLPAQQNLGVATSNYSTLNSIYLNPANIAGSNEKVSINLISLSLAADNNFITFNDLSELGNKGEIKPGKGGTFNAVLPAVDLRLPGVMVGLNDRFKQSFALTTRLRGINQLNNFSQDLYSMVQNKNRSDQDYQYQTKNFNWTAHVWNELALSYAMVPYDKGPHKIKAGITLRYIGGIDYLSLKGKNLVVDYKGGTDSFYASHSDIEFASNAISADNAYANGVSSSDVINNFFGAKAGGGFGMDIGVVYEYKIGYNSIPTDTTDGKKNDVHILRLSAAITDIGSIKYKSDHNYFVNVSGNGYLDGKNLSDHIKDYQDLKNYAVTQGFTADTGRKETKLHMPTALNLGADYQLYKRFYVNALFIANLANRQNYGNSYYSQITVTPRFDSKMFSFGLPITYSSLAKEVKAGIGIRFAGFFAGSDDMLALLGGNQHGVSAYFGGYLSIYRKAPKVKNAEAEKP